MCVYVCLGGKGKDGGEERENQSALTNACEYYSECAFLRVMFVRERCLRVSVCVCTRECMCTCVCVWACV